MENRIIVLYHRPPYEEVLKAGKIFFKQHEKPNGIIPLLKSFFSSVTNSVWVAASTLSEKASSPLREDISFIDSKKCLTLRRVPVTADEMHKFYYKSSKEGFWPILHTFPGKFVFESIDWENFEMINQRFAEAACDEIANDEDIIWIHDYNLWLAPYYIRKQKPNNRIAFFFHTPFPAADTFNILPWRKQIIESVLCCDFVSFDIPRYVENFIATAKSNTDFRILKKEAVSEQFACYGSALSEAVMTKEIMFNDRIIRFDAFPEGTNLALVQEILDKESTVERIAKYEEIKGGKRLIFAASRTDYIKGTIELLMCYERLLSRNPNRVAELMLLLVAVKPAEGMAGYTETQREIDALVDGINERYRSKDSTPILYSDKAFSFEEMISWFVVSDVMWIPSLRDGMNIICKEFVVTKRCAEGVLILSEFAGASVELTDAVLTNPYSPESMDSAIDEALAMPFNEQRVRMSKMFDRTMMSDIKIWSKQLSQLEGLKLECEEKIDV